MVAPIGFGLGDFVVVGKAALKLYHRVRESAAEYGQLRTETKQFSDLLENFRDLVTRIKLSRTQFAQLVEHEKNSQRLLDAVNEVLDRYQNLGGDAPKLSKKITWSKATAQDLRSRITSHVCILQSSYMSISQCAVLDALERLKLGMQAGTTRCPSLAVLSQASDDDGDSDESGWSGLIRDLENLGITADMAQKQRALILRYFENAIALGQLPFKDGSVSLYSGPVCAYKNILEEVTAWIQTCSSEVASIYNFDQSMSTDVRVADRQREDRAQESVTESTIDIDVLGFSHGSTEPSINFNVLGLHNDLASSTIDLDILGFGHFSVDADTNPLLLCVNLLLRCKPYKRCFIDERKSELVCRDKWKKPSLRFLELYDLAIRTLSSKLASGFRDANIMASFVAFVNVDVLLNGPTRMGHHAKAMHMIKPHHKSRREPILEALQTAFEHCGKTVRSVRIIYTQCGFVWMMNMGYRCLKIPVD